MDGPFHFISYSSADGADFALRLADALTAGPPSFPAWLDKRHIPMGADWDAEIDHALRTCETLIFVMTPDSVKSRSVCQDEWDSALKFKKSIVPLHLHADVMAPFRLRRRQHIDFTANFERGLAQLRQHLAWLSTPEGRLHTLRDRLADAERDLQRANDDDRPRILKEIEQLNEDIAALEAAVRNPAAAAKRQEESIAARIEVERQPARPVTPAARTRFINPTPMVAPPYFQDRLIETRLIARFLRTDGLRLMTIDGRGGVGKSALVCRVLKALEAGHLPDDLGPLAVDGIVYLSQVGAHRVDVANLYTDLCRLLPGETAQRLDALYREGRVSTRDKLLALAEAFQGPPVVVLLDNLETLVDAETRTLTDAELKEALVALLHAPQHSLKLIITMRGSLVDLPLVHPQRQRWLRLDAGLDSPHAETVLRELDADGTVGLKAASDAVLGEVRERTRGFPRALEAFYGSLAADRSTTPAELLARAEHSLPDNVVEDLVGEAFSRLDRTAQMVMQVLAVYARPAPAVAVDYLLQPSLPLLDSTATLNRLVNTHFVRREAGRYSLHPVDAAYALARVPEGEVGDEDDEAPGRAPKLFWRKPATARQAGEAGGATWTQTALRRRAADYFKTTRRPRAEWRSLADLEPQLAEFDLRCAAGQVDAAARLLREIDFDYLLLWGHARRLVEMHERLRGRVKDKWLQASSANVLGLAYTDLGQVNKAIACHEQALAVWREIGDRHGEGAALTNLGGTYLRLGQLDKAIGLYQQRLVIARETGNRGGEGAALGNLGLAYADLGQLDKAIDFYQQQLVIAREIGDRRSEGNALGNLGAAYFQLGQLDKAIDFYQQQLLITRGIGDRRGEGTSLSNLAEAYAALGDTARATNLRHQALDIAHVLGDKYSEALRLVGLGDLWLGQGKLTEAMIEYERALAIAEKTGLAQCQSEAQMGLALARLLLERPAEALAAARAGRAANYALQLHTLVALEGVAALGVGDQDAARQAFQDSIAHADGLLAHTPRLFTALEAKGLALAGLALLDAPGRVADAVAAFRAARAITDAPGFVGRAAQMVDALARYDRAGLLAPVRAAARGEPGSA